MIKNEIPFTDRKEKNSQSPYMDISASCSQLLNVFWIDGKTF